MLDYEKLMALDLDPIEHSYGPKDCILYALGVGLGQDPTDERQLAFVYEKDLQVLPTFAVTLGYSPYSFRRPELGITWSHVVHGEHGLVLHKSIRPEGTVVGKVRILDVVDKGAGKGALIYSERSITDKARGDLLATITQTTFCRADGGFGGTKRETPAPHEIPQRAPDAVCDLPTRPETALIYRLSGDINPLRDYYPARVAAMWVRFSAPVFPGETLRSELWRDGGVVSFRARVVERDVIAINNGRAELK
jgi:hypothetical protein